MDFYYIFTNKNIYFYFNQFLTLIGNRPFTYMYIWTNLLQKHTEKHQKNV